MTDIITPDILQEKIISWLNSLYPSCPDARDYFRTFPDVNIREMIESVTVLVEAGIIDKAAIRLDDSETFLKLSGLKLTPYGHKFASYITDID